MRFCHLLHSGLVKAPTSLWILHISTDLSEPSVVLPKPFLLNYTKIGEGQTKN